MKRMRVRAAGPHTPSPGELRAKIAIDPGHGMSNRAFGAHDPGGRFEKAGVRFEEASMVLRYARTLRDAFHARGIFVFMTRDDADDHAPLTERVGNAVRAGAQLLVSLHVNDFEETQANGLEVLYRDPASLALAQALQSTLVRVTALRDRGAKRRTDLEVLRFPGLAALIEMGFIGNDDDRAILINPERRVAICDAIADTVLPFLAARSVPAPRSRSRAGMTTASRTRKRPRRKST